MEIFEVKTYEMNLITFGKHITTLGIIASVGTDSLTFTYYFIPHINKCLSINILKCLSKLCTDLSGNELHKQVIR